MKTWQWILIALGGIWLFGVLSGHLITKAFIKQPAQGVEDKPPAITWVATQIPPSRDTTIVSRQPHLDTSTTTLESDSIKTKVTTIEDSTKSYVNNQPHYQPFTMNIVADNYYGYSITEMPRNVTTKSSQPTTKFIQFYGSLAVSLSNQKRLLSEIELDSEFYERLILFGRVEAEIIDDSLKVCTRIGLKAKF